MAIPTGSKLKREVMKNRTLAQDYIERATHRLAALDVLFERGSWADVVRESQEVVELALKSLLRSSSIEVPRVHDVSRILEDEKTSLPAATHSKLERLAAISRALRRDRELSFYGSEDLTPSDFYQQTDAVQARNDARWVVEVVSAAVLAPVRRKRRSRQR
jgi:HEPN domain-containing protein